MSILIICMCRAVKSRGLRWAVHIARMEEDRKGFKMLISQPTGKRPTGRLRRRWQDNIRIERNRCQYEELG